MTGRADVIAAYADDAARLAPRFEALSPAKRLRPVIDFLQPSPVDVADIGAGTGRDAAWLAGMGHRDTAIEPVAEFIRYGRAHHRGAIEWIPDRLPKLDTLRARNRTFDFVLVCSVWHHLTAAQSLSAMRSLAQLLRPKGALAVSLKVFRRDANQPADPLELETVSGHARASGLARRFAVRCPAQQEHNRLAGNTWDWMVFHPGQARWNR